MNVDRAGKIELDTIPGLIILAKHLIASADCEEGLFIFHSRADLCCFSGPQVFQKDFLFKILTSANEEDIIAVCIQRFSDRAAFYIDLDSPINSNKYGKQRRDNRDTGTVRVCDGGDDQV